MATPTMEMLLQRVCQISHAQAKRVHMSAVAPAAAVEAKPKRNKTFAIYRYNPDKSDKPTMQEYVVDLNTVEIRREGLEDEKVIDNSSPTLNTPPICVEWK